MVCVGVGDVVVVVVCGFYWFENYVGCVVVWCDLVVGVWVDWFVDWCGV